MKARRAAPRKKAAPRAAMKNRFPPMRKQDREITGAAALDAILTNASVCRLGMVDDGQPYVVPMNFGYRDHCLYFHSATSGRKIDVLRKNNRVCFEIEDGSAIVKHELPCRWSTRYRSIIGYGTIRIITGEAEKRRGLDVILEHYGGNNAGGPYDPESVGRLVILELKIERMTGKQSGVADIPGGEESSI